ncbi:MAG TPA: hypothetical protein VHE83_02985 [Mycobacteriales bacterium]|nr:hypothetical protein [Mycobacteriales bacterium]
MNRPRSVAALCVAAAASLTACGSSTQAPPAVTPTLASACPTVSVAPVDWPKILPADLPKPPGAVLTGETVQNNVVYLRFNTSSSLREGLLYMLRELPKAGYTIGRGDAEVTEADVPFTNPAVIAALRLTVAGTCATSWILAVGRRAASTGVLQPNSLIPHTVPAGASPLPFG